MRERKRSVLLRPPTLVVMVALLLAVSGVLYAHWTATLSLDGNVNTGSVGVGWFGAWTNDDGADNNDAEPAASPVYDAWGDGSSADPKGPGSNPARWDKDVAACYANAGGNHLNVQIWGAYPSYNCTMTALVGGQGNVPVRATTTDLTATKGGFCGFFYSETENPYFGEFVNWDNDGPFGDVDNDGVFEDGDIRLEDKCVGGQYTMEVRPGLIEGTFAFGLPGGPDEIEGDISAGIRCGTQVDPVSCWWVLDGATYEGPVVGDDQGNAYVDVDQDGNYNPEIDGPALTQECDLVNDTMETSGWIHVLQPASQNSWYQWNLTQDFVNWNEWDVTMCTPGSWVDPDGIPNNGDEYRYIP